MNLLKSFSILSWCFGLCSLMSWIIPIVVGVPKLLIILSIIYPYSSKAFPSEWGSKFIPSVLVSLQDKTGQIMSAHLIKSWRANKLNDYYEFFLPEIIRSLFRIKDLGEGKIYKLWNGILGRLALQTNPSLLLTSS